MTNTQTYILGIETSCDETAAAVIASNRACEGGDILSNVVLTQLDDHMPYGGVVPEIAARAHLHHIDSIIDRAITHAGIAYDDLSAVAATTGPGLIGGVMVGMQAGKALSHALDIPFMAINHLEAHILTPRLTDRIPYPFLSILMSGGHCQILSVNALGDYTVLGETIDDSVGEAFDKVAKMMGLPYPGGPEIDRRAHLGDSTAFPLPRPLTQHANCDFSFSGLKTRVRHLLSDLDRKKGDNQQEGTLFDHDINNMAASFQQAVTDVFLDRTQNAIAKFKTLHPSVQKPTIVVAGGVAANSHIRTAMTHVADSMGMTFCAPPLNLCTDNGVMIAWAGLERFEAGIRDPINTPARPRWPLMDLSIPQ